MASFLMRCVSKAETTLGVRHREHIKTVTKKTTASVKVVTCGKNSKNKTVSKTIKVTVNPKREEPTTTEETKTVSQVKVTAAKTSLVVGDTTTATATVVPANATDRRITWQSTNENVATVTSDGVVTAIASGETDIVVETVDGGFKATCHITVASSSTADIDKIEASVQNAIEGYPNTVLVGTRAQIRVTVTKDGAPFGDDTAALELKSVSGYTSYYELEKDTIDLNKNGTGTAYIKLKSAYADDYDATIDDSKSWKDAAYASFKLTVRAGGADLVQDVPITFAQIMIGNELSLNNQNTPALTVTNKTDGNGLIDITFEAPKEACKYTVSAFINEDKPISQTFDFKAVTEAFTLQADVTDGQNKRIVLSSNGQMDASILKAAMFTLSDNGKTVSIEKIEKGSSADKIVITTKETFSADLTITYKPIVTDEKTGQVFYFLNANGTLYKVVAANNVTLYNAAEDVDADAEAEETDVDETVVDEDTTDNIDVDDTTVDTIAE